MTVGRVTEQILAVAKHRHICRVHGKLFLRHDVDRDMGEIEVFELHVADGELHSLKISLPR